ncbi:MAG: hypothetical protein ABI880_06395 [Acidobacteriota bacterium]
MLHIVTPLFRHELLDRVYRSLPPHDDVVWHLVTSSRRPAPDHPFLRADPRIRVYAIDCDDADIVAKRNTAFAAIRDGYFYLLDDDTLCLPELYRVYAEYSAAGFEGMIVGSTTMVRARLPSLDPAVNRLDAGAVLCSQSVLRTVHWQWSADYPRDRLFWTACFAHFGPGRTVVVDRTISAYNALGALVRVRKRWLGWQIAWDIKQPQVARVYLMLAEARRHVRSGVRALWPGRA